MFLQPLCRWWLIWPIQNNAKIWKMTETLPKGTHLRVLGESYQMNTNMTVFRWISKILRYCVLDKISLSIGRVNRLKIIKVQAIRWRTVCTPTCSQLPHDTAIILVKLLCSSQAAASPLNAGPRLKPGSGKEGCSSPLKQTDSRLTSGDYGFTLSLVTPVWPPKWQG